MAASIAITAWQALEAHYAKISKLHLRQLFADDPQRGEKMVLEAVGLYSRLLQEPHYVRNARSVVTVWRRNRASMSEWRPCFAATKSTSRKSARSCTWPCARRAARSIMVDGENVVPGVHAVLDKMADFCHAHPQRRMERPYRQAHPQRREYRHRRLRSGSGHGL